jgi:protease-4
MTETELSSTEVPKQRKNMLRRGGCLWWLLLPLVAGLLLAYFLAPRPAVGIIRVQGDIYTFSAEFVGQQIQEARLNPRIRAVVVQIDSPGGEVAATQSMYYELLSLREKMPVVGSIDSMAASGGFYTAMATSPIYAKPSSTVGNVGVWGYVPSDIGVNDYILASGPFKLTASNSEEFLREIEGIKQEFLQTVKASRGAALNISLFDLSQGLAYPGRQAMDLGLIDQLGSMQEAIDEAARLAKIANYEVIDLQQLVIDKYYEENPLYYYKPWVGVAEPSTGQRDLPPGIYLLYDMRLGSTR